ncbi:MAG: hypothetical protein Q9170_007530 [Blastenia crenularia]
MAVVNLLTAQILVDGNPLPEYNDDDPDETALPKTIIRYIEAPTDAAFSVCHSISKDFQMTGEGLDFVFKMDGKEVIRSFCSIESFTRRTEDTCKVIDGLPVRDESGAVHLRPFRFSRIDIGKLEGSMSSTNSFSTTRGYSRVSTTASFSNVEDLGKIVIKVFLVKKVKPWDRKCSRDVLMKPIKTRSKSLKPRGITQSITLGAPEPREGSNLRYHVSVDKNPIATFVFKYRTKEALQQPLVIRDNADLEIEAVEDLTVGELKEAARRLQNRPEKPIKRYNKISIHKRLQTIKQEPQSRVAPEPISISSTESHETISKHSTIGTPELISQNSTLIRDFAIISGRKRSLSLSTITPETVSTHGSTSTIPDDHISPNAFTPSLPPRPIPTQHNTNPSLRSKTPALPQNHQLYPPTPPLPASNNLRHTTSNTNLQPALKPTYLPNENPSSRHLIFLHNRDSGRKPSILVQEKSIIPPPLHQRIVLHARDSGRGANIPLHQNTTIPPPHPPPLPTTKKKQKSFRCRTNLIQSLRTKAQRSKLQENGLLMSSFYIAEEGKEEEGKEEEGEEEEGKEEEGLVFAFGEGTSCCGLDM